jgi:hypothetical protein
MFRRRMAILIVLSAASLALIYWPVPYSEIDLLNTSFVFRWTLSAFLLAVISKPILRLKATQTTLFITLGYVGSILARALYESQIETASHNLLIFEILFGIFNTAPPALLGSFIGQYFQYKIHGDEDE